MKRHLQRKLGMSRLLLGGGHRLVLKSSALGRLKLTKLLWLLCLLLVLGNLQLLGKLSRLALLQDLQKQTVRMVA